MPATLTLTRPLAEAATPAEGPGRLLIQIITPGWGASGYYSADVLEQAAQDRVFPAGTHMYLDHPTPTEDYERPVRSVRDLSAVLLEDARWDGSRLVAEARVFSQWRQPIADMAESIGVSIRADAEVEIGAAEGRTGRIVTRLLTAKSVDFVTRAGRDGKVLEVLEHASAVAEARSVGQWVESRIHSDFTTLADEMFGDGRLTRPERITLSAAIGDALAAFVTRVETDAPDLYQRDPWDEPPTTPPTVAETVPVTPAGQPTTQESEEDAMPQIEEAQQRQLEEAARRVPTLDSELDAERKRADAAEAKLAEALKTTNLALAEKTVREAFDAAGVSAPKTVARLASAAPLTESGDIDTDALKAAAEESAAELAEAAGAGRVRGLGGTNQPTDATVSEADVQASVAAAFGRTTQEA